jgi:PAS domain S-box-containing protein
MRMSTPLRIIVESKKGFGAEAVESALRDAGFLPEFSEVGGVGEMGDAAGEGPVDLIISERERITNGDAGELVEAVDRLWPDTPLIIAAEEHGEDQARRAVLAGAHDCVPRSDQDRFAASVVRAAREAVRWRDDLAVFRTYFRNLFEHSPEAIVLMDSNENIIDVNKAFVDLFQYQPQEVAGRRISDVIVPEGKQEEYVKLREQVYGGRMVRRDTTRRRKDGSHARVSVIGCPIMLGDRTFGVYAIYSDITRQMKAIQTLRQAESNYRQFFLNAPEGMYIATNIGRYMTVNPAMADLLGYDSPSDLTDNVKNIAREIYVDPERREEALEEIKKRGKIMDFKSWVRRKDGREILVSENVRVVRDEDGDLLYYQGTMREARESGF